MYTRSKCPSNIFLLSVILRFIFHDVVEEEIPSVIIGQSVVCCANEGWSRKIVSRLRIVFIIIFQTLIMIFSLRI